MSRSEFLKTIRDRLADDLLARRVDRWITGAIAVLLATAGFLAGRWTSFTNRATPIVFQEAPGGESSVATPEDLQALVAAAETPQPTKAPVRAPAPQKTVTGSPVQPKPTVAAAQKTVESPGAFVASVNGKKYYTPSCKEVRRIKEENLVWFDSEEEAKESGYEPSVCVQKGR